MLKIGVFGAGHLGKIHIQQWADIPQTQLVGFYDPNDHHAAAAEEKYGIKRYSDPKKLIADCDALDIVTPTIHHFEIAKECILNYKHVFIEKPITHTLEEAASLVKLVEEADIKCQIGHIERYNPAFTALKGVALNPMFIEAHRLATFNPRGTDVSVILDLMIHDIDIVLSLVKSKVKRISASGVAIVSQTPDIANARIEFDNGCVANLTSSRISLKKMRKTRLFQKDAYISIDFLEKKTEVVRLSDTQDLPPNALSMPIELGNAGEKKSISIAYPPIKDSNALQMELADFAYAILSNSPVKVPVYDGFYALEVATKILDRIQNAMQTNTSDLRSTLKDDKKN